MSRVLATLTGAILLALPALSQATACVASTAVATFRLAVAPSGADTAVWVPVRRLNNIPTGYRIRYQPVKLPDSARDDGGLTLVLVPADASREVTVLQPGPLNVTSEWVVPFDVRLLLFVFAPEDLDEKRLQNLITTDQELVAALGDYARQTAELEASLEELAYLDQNEDPMEELTPAEEALIALVEGLNPAASFDPLGAGRRAGPTTLMGRGADAFFENAGGFVPGGGILPTVKGWLMPDTEFRSVYAVGDEMSAGGDMTLCAQRLPKGRNDLAYVWAYGLTTEPAPALRLAGNAGPDNPSLTDVPLGRRSDVAILPEQGTDWDLVRRVFEWSLRSNAGVWTVRAHPMPDSRELRLDLREFAGGPGVYRIQGRWDWGTLEVEGSLRLHQLDDLSAAEVTVESRDRFVTNTGLVKLNVAGPNLRFIERAWMHRPESVREVAVDLPAAPDADPNRLRVEVDTDGLRPGPYLLALERVDGESVEIPLRLLPEAPRLNADEAPRVNQGAPEQTIVLTGSGLDRIQALRSGQAEVELGETRAGGAQREVTIRLSPGVQAGERVSLLAQVEGRSQPVDLGDAVEVTGERPRIVEARASLPDDLAVELREGEIPGGTWVSFALSVEPAELQPGLRLSCAEAADTVQALALTPGEADPTGQLTSPGAGRLFASFDPGVIGRTGCELVASAEAPQRGSSEPFALGTVIRLPRIDSFSLTNEPAGDGAFYGELSGWELESIQRTGWDAATGLEVTELPRPVPGESGKQTLRIAMPWPSPSPKAPLFVWLAGEESGRATRITQ